MALHAAQRRLLADKDATDSKENVFCLHLSSPASLDNVHDCLLDIADGDLQVSNTYFTACARVRVLQDDTGSSADTLELLRSCAAVMLFVNCASTVKRSQKWWTSFSISVQSEAVRLFVADFSFPEEEKLDQLRTWGVENDIEIVTPEICAEDGITVRARIRSALDCADWPQKASREDGLGVAGEAVRSQLRSENSVRRALREEDVQKITNELLSLGDVESDSE